jgi:Zn-dependent protease with chaperone function
MAHRRGWSRRKLTLILALAALIACLPVTIASPLQIIDMIVALGMSGNLTLLGVDGFLISLLLGVFGTFIGAWFGRRMGESMQQGER